ncbi:MAG: TIGR03617 family F420-dependent LLM class oxidoreductase [Anaerolineae bacterium]|nr:TIGR03617 family F420-dependent LLM class oxidoreductase [Anaerolineae bacterium]
MKFDTTLSSMHLKSVPGIAMAAETMGFDGVWVSETQHSPFLPGPLIAEHTNTMQFGTAVAISFARSPASLAYTAWDLAEASKGRFILGLGTQVKAHIERRFGMPWPESVVGKLREQIAAVRAFWRTWQFGDRLNVRGEYYDLTLMAPFFNPGPIRYPDIPIYIAGVNTGLARLAGETANGFHVHPLNSQRYLQEVIIPAIKDGREKFGRKRDDVSLSATVFVVTSPAERSAARQQISFYASTPSYRRVFALHGWEDVAEQLSRLASVGKWDKMPDLISDEILATFAVIADPDHLCDALRDRYQDLVSRLNLYIPFIPGERDGFWRKLLKGIKA